MKRYFPSLMVLAFIGMLFRGCAPGIVNLGAINKNSEIKVIHSHGNPKVQKLLQEMDKANNAPNILKSLIVMNEGEEGLEKYGLHDSKGDAFLQATLFDDTRQPPKKVKKAIKGLFYSLISTGQFQMPATSNANLQQGAKSVESKKLFDKTVKFKLV